MEGIEWGKLVTQVMGEQRNQQRLEGSQAWARWQDKVNWGQLAKVGSTTGFLGVQLQFSLEKFTWAEWEGLFFPPAFQSPSCAFCGLSPGHAERVSP